MASHKAEPMAFHEAAMKHAAKAAAQAAHEAERAVLRLTAKTTATAPKLHTSQRAAARSGFTRSASMGVRCL